MPRSFLINKTKRVRTGFFPWNEETLVQGCCSEYRLGGGCDVKKEEEITRRYHLNGNDEDFEIDVVDAGNNEESKSNKGKNRVFQLPFSFVSRVFLERTSY